MRIMSEYILSDNLIKFQVLRLNRIKKNILIYYNITILNVSIL